MIVYSITIYRNGTQWAATDYNGLQGVWVRVRVVVCCCPLR